MIHRPKKQNQDVETGLDAEIDEIEHELLLRRMCTQLAFGLAGRQMPESRPLRGRWAAYRRPDRSVEAP